MKRCLMTLFWVALAVSGVLAQDKKTVPPPPKPTDGEPNALPPTQSQLVQLASKIVPLCPRVRVITGLA